MKPFIATTLFSLFTCLGWTQPVHTSSGTVQRFERFASQYVDARNVDVWLPDGYNRHKKYAVLYMHDGQMLFDSSSTWNKQAWAVDEIAGRLLRVKQIKDCIIVGVWNNGAKRHVEYFPQKAFYSLSETEKQQILNIGKDSGAPLIGNGPISDKYLQFLVEELKPFIDSHFSTHKNRKNTFLAGSSMGGLISMYALCEYPQIFGGAACLSTHWIGTFSVENNPIPAAFMQYLAAHLPAPKSHKIYFDYGTEGLDALYKPFQQQADIIMKSKGYVSRNWITRDFPGADHSEKSWHKRFDIPLTFLLGNKT